MLPIGNGEYIGGLSDRFADSSDQLCAVGFRYKGGFLANYADQYNDKANNARRKERQLVSDICRVLLEGFQCDAVRKGARRVENTIRDRQTQCLPRLGIFEIGDLLAFCSELLILVRFDKTKSDDAGTYQNERDIMRTPIPSVPKKMMEAIAAKAPEELQIGEETESSM